SIYVGFYILSRWKEISTSGGITNDIDFVVGCLAVLLILEATRRALGWPLTLIGIIFLIYPFFGEYLPSVISSRTYSLDRIVDFLYTSTQGIYGIPIGVSA